jgi:hypothetical protein
MAFSEILVSLVIFCTCCQIIFKQVRGGSTGFPRISCSSAENFRSGLVDILLDGILRGDALLDEFV